MIDNEFVPDLPEELWDGDETTAQIHRAGERLDALDLLPSPFPLDGILSARDCRHVQLLYGIGGLSYGNVSARVRRRRAGFWMSASGVDKSDMRVVGEHICFVEGFDAERRLICLRVPPDVKPRRVSVDAIEHWMIYREHPEVGAIVHIHAWMDGHRVDRDQLPVRHGGAGPGRRRPRARGARSRAGRRRPAATTASRSPASPRRDLRAHRRPGDRPGAR